MILPMFVKCADAQTVILGENDYAISRDQFLREAGNVY